MIPIMLSDSEISSPNNKLKFSILDRFIASALHKKAKFLLIIWNKTIPSYYSISIHSPSELMRHLDNSEHLDDEFVSATLDLDKNITEVYNDIKELKFVEVG